MILLVEAWNVNFNVRSTEKWVEVRIGIQESFIFEFVVLKRILLNISIPILRSLLLCPMIRFYFSNIADKFTPTVDMLRSAEVPFSLTELRKKIAKSAHNFLSRKNTIVQKCNFYIIDMLSQWKVKSSGKELVILF